MSSQNISIVRHTIISTLRRATTRGSHGSLVAACISLHDKVQALLSTFPHYHEQNDLIALVRKACSTTFLLHFALNKPEVEVPGRMTTDYEMMRIQIEHVLHGNNLATQLYKAIDFVNGLLDEQYYDTSRRALCPATCGLPGTLDARCIDRIRAFDNTVMTFNNSMKLSSDPVLLTEHIVKMPGFAFILSGNKFLPRLSQVEQDFFLMSELQSGNESSERALWSVCLYARGVSQVSDQSTLTHARDLIRSTLRYYRDPRSRENSVAIVQILDSLPPANYQGWDRDLPPGVSGESVLGNIRSVRARLMSN